MCFPEAVCENRSWLCHGQIGVGAVVANLVRSLQLLMGTDGVEGSCWGTGGRKRDVQGS